MQNKRTTKRQIYNAEILNRLQKKYGCSSRFITMSVKGTRESETSKSIAKDYEAMEKKVSDFIKTL